VVITFVEIALLPFLCIVRDGIRAYRLYIEVSIAVETEVLYQCWKRTFEHFVCRGNRS